MRLKIDLADVLSGNAALRKCVPSPSLGDWGLGTCKPVLNTEQTIIFRVPDYNVGWERTWTKYIKTSKH